MRANRKLLAKKAGMEGGRVGFKQEFPKQTQKFNMSGSYKMFYLRIFCEILLQDLLWSILKTDIVVKTVIINFRIPQKNSIHFK